MSLEESIAMDLRKKTKSSIDDSTWERLIEKLSVIYFDPAVRSIKTETGELGKPVSCATVPRHPVAAAAVQDLPDLSWMLMSKTLKLLMITTFATNR